MFAVWGVAPSCCKYCLVLLVPHLASNSSQNLSKITIYRSEFTVTVIPFSLRIADYGYNLRCADCRPPTRGMAPVILLVQVLDSPFTPKLSNPLENSRSGGWVISSELLSVGFMNFQETGLLQIQLYAKCSLLACPQPGSCSPRSTV